METKYTNSKTSQVNGCHSIRSKSVVCSVRLFVFSSLLILVLMASTLAFADGNSSDDARLGKSAKNRSSDKAKNQDS